MSFLLLFVYEDMFSFCGSGGNTPGFRRLNLTVNFRCFFFFFFFAVCRHDTYFVSFGPATHFQAEMHDATQLQASFSTLVWKPSVYQMVILRIKDSGPQFVLWSVCRVSLPKMMSHSGMGSPALSVEESHFQT